MCILSQNYALHGLHLSPKAWKKLLCYTHVLEILHNINSGNDYNGSVLISRKSTSEQLPWTTPDNAFENEILQFQYFGGLFRSEQ